MKLALQQISEGMSVSSASKAFGIPRTTLQDKKFGRHQRSVGAPTILRQDEEKVFINWIVELRKQGFPVTKDQFLYSVSKYMAENGRINCFKDGIPGHRWYEGFLNRHKEISKRVPQYLSTARANISEEEVRNWHAKIKNFFEEYGDLKQILTCSNRIFNCDETAFYLCPKDKFILAKKGSKQIYIVVEINDEKECLTVLIGASATGCLMPPLTLFPYKRMPQNIVAKMPKNWGIRRTDSGWMTCETFYEYITNIFYPYLQLNNIEFPVVMFLDGHSSHFSLHLSTFCREKGIILIGLIPNATHLLQPMDVSLFHPLKNEWKKIIREWRINNNGERLKREDFSGLVNECLQRAAKPETIRNGFRICGLYPFDVNAVPFEKLLKTTADDSEKTENIRSILSVIESTIGVERLKEFKRCEKDQWNGQTKDEGLFNFWLDIRKKIPDSSLQNMIISENNQQEHNTTLEANINFSALELDENFAANGVIDLDINADGSVVISIPKSSCADTSQIFRQFDNSPISNLTEQ
ncbi:LOW QUALITY PROTEIN: uncharacterized protein [Polyergus mexicanus]|uniref:LOW QUALITY PROTEIN: uncharacterized protein n=1 Tax=Polyergus mexicanus TaxID=615972 RepID=UPI0038B4ACAF